MILIVSADDADDRAAVRDRLVSRYGFTPYTTNEIHAPGVFELIDANGEDVVISDVAKKSEVAALQYAGARCLYVTHDGIFVWVGEGCPDYVLRNTGTITDLYTRINDAILDIIESTGRASRGVRLGLERHDKETCPR